MARPKAIVILGMTACLLGGAAVPAHLAYGRQAPALVWAQTYSASSTTDLSDRAVGVGLNETHAYAGGTKTTSASNSAFAVVQHVLGTGAIRSTASFPSTPGPYQATCMTSFTPLNGLNQPRYFYDGVANIRVYLAGFVQTSSLRYPMIAAFDIENDADSSNFGNLRLMWSWAPDENREDEVPVAITVTENHLAMVCRLTTNSEGLNTTVRVLNAETGATVLGRRTYTSSGAADDVPIGVVIDNNFVIVGGNGSTGTQQAMMAFAYNISAYSGGTTIAAGTFHGASGPNTSPVFVSSGSGRSFVATCATSGANSHANGNPAGNILAVAGREWLTSNSSNGDWLVDAFVMVTADNVTSVSPYWQSPSTGKSSSSFDDVPIAACLTPIHPDEEPITEDLRLLVTGVRTPLSSGKTEITTVQFMASPVSLPPNPIGGGDIEWYDHFLFSRNGTDRDAAPSSISLTGYSDHEDQVRIFVGANVESTSGSYNSDYLMLKYKPDDTGGAQKDNMWLGSEPVYSAGQNNRTQVSTASNSITLGTSPSNAQRVILITGWGNFSTTGDDILTLRYDDDSN